MFERYGIVDEQDILRAFEAVERYVAKLPTGENAVVSFPNSSANSPAKS